MYLSNCLYLSYLQPGITSLRFQIILDILYRPIIFDIIGLNNVLLSILRSAIAWTDVTSVELVAVSTLETNIYTSRPNEMKQIYRYPIQ